MILEPPQFYSFYGLVEHQNQGNFGEGKVLKI